MSGEALESVSSAAEVVEVAQSSSEIRDELITPDEGLGYSY